MTGRLQMQKRMLEFQGAEILWFLMNPNPEVTLMGIMALARLHTRATRGNRWVAGS